MHLRVSLCEGPALILVRFRCGRQHQVERQGRIPRRRDRANVAGQILLLAPRSSQRLPLQVYCPAQRSGAGKEPNQRF